MAIEPLQLRAADGPVLQAELSVPAEPWAAVVLAHPHPTRGGNMRSLVTGSLFADLAGAGVAVIRFNFRGVEGSSGSYDHGLGEQHDIVAAIDALAPVTEGLPLVVSGWSFGADTSLAVTDQRLSGWAPVAPPLRFLEADGLAAGRDPRPKCVIMARHDQFRTPEEAEPLLERWLNVESHVVEGADHFFVGRTEKVAEIMLDWMRRLPGTVDADGLSRPGGR